MPANEFIPTDPTTPAKSDRCQPFGLSAWIASRSGSRPYLTILATLINCDHRSERRAGMNEHLLQLQNGADYTMSLMRYLIEVSEDLKEFIDATWEALAATSPPDEYTCSFPRQWR
jgi:hypothetical protein